MVHEKELQKLFELIDEIEICMMTTVDSDGHLRSRPMATQTTYSGEDLWFFTRSKAGKVEEIKEHEAVNLSYASPSGKQFVSISGRASMERNKKKMKELWTPAYRAWFPEGLDDPSLGLMRVQIEKAEYWDSPSGLVVHLIGFTKAMLTGSSYRPGENKKIDATLH